LVQTCLFASKLSEIFCRIAILDYAGMKDVNADEVAARVIDNSVLDKLQKEKLFDNLFGKKK
jgi:hypothetical protein